MGVDAAASHLAATGASDAESSLETAADSLQNAAGALLDARFVDCSQQGGWIVEDASMSAAEAGEVRVLSRK